MLVLRIRRHAPNPITAPPSTMMPTMIASTTRMAFSAPPPAGGAPATGGAAMAGWAAAPVELAAVLWKPELPVKAAPHLVQNFPVPSSVVPQDVQNAITHLGKQLCAEYSAPAACRERNSRRGFPAIARLARPSHPTSRGGIYADCLAGDFWSLGGAVR